MIINTTNLSALFIGFKAAFGGAFTGAPSYFERIAMRIQSSTGENDYGWLGQTPAIREWIGDRHIKSMQALGFKIKNRTFESTVAVSRVHIEDDQYGVFTPMVSEMGRRSKQHPDVLIAELLASGFAAACYDGQYFFDSDHPVKNAAGVDTVASNVQAGAAAAWYLFDTAKAVRALIFQERQPYDLQSLNRPDDANVFLRDEYLYGVRARANVGFGLWQLAFGSKATLDKANYEAARAAMMNLRGDEGGLLGITPSVLVVPPSLEGAARRLIVAATGDAGASNEWAGSAELIVLPYLS